LYLDSTFECQRKLGKKPELNFYYLWQGKLFNLKKEFNKAILIFENLKPTFEKYNKSQTLLYKAMGVSYLGLGAYEKGIQVLEKAAQNIIKYNTHFDNLPEIHELLAEAYSNVGKSKEAFENEKLAMEYEKKYFDSRSEVNVQILEIQNEFQRYKELKEREKEHQELEWLQEETKRYKYQNFLFILALIIVSVGFYLLLKRRWQKYEKEKKAIEKEKQLEILKKEDTINNVKKIVEEKNKELVTSTLKLIKKDKILKSDEEVEKMIYHIANNKDQNWEEFEARFVCVNSEFYQKLYERFPDLTQGDKKLCALIKLNFSSKEIAGLLNMSVNSVHTSRSRLRKKLDLDRTVNLTEYIASI